MVLIVISPVAPAINVQIDFVPVQFLLEVKNLFCAFSEGNHIVRWRRDTAVMSANAYGKYDAPHKTLHLWIPVEFLL